MRRKLRDMDEELSGYGPQMIHGEDGRLYFAWAAIPEHFTECVPFPANLPINPLPPGEDVDGLDYRNAATLNNIEMRLLGGGPLQAITDISGQDIFTRAIPVAVRQAHPFQVVWLGSRRQWILTEGKVGFGTGFAMTEVVREFKRTPLDPKNGWLVLPLKLTPSWFGYDLQASSFALEVGEPYITAQPVQKPPTVQWILDGTLFTDGFSQRADWKPGTINFPIAYLEPPNGSHRTPRIIPALKGNVMFLSKLWPGSMPKFAITP